MSFTSKEDVARALPTGASKKVTDKVFELVKMMGETTGVMQDYMEEMFANNSNILKGKGGISLTTYVNALSFVTLKQRMTNEEAWRIVFPERYESLSLKGKLGNLSANVSMYNRSDVVSTIEANILVDFNRFYDWARHEAMMKQVKLMRGEAAPTVKPVFVFDKELGREVEKRDKNGEIIYKKTYPNVSPTVQQAASAEILRITQPVEEQTIHIKHGLSDEAVTQQRETSDALRALAVSQREKLLAGTSISDVQVIGHVLNGDNDDS